MAVALKRFQVQVVVNSCSLCLRVYNNNGGKQHKTKRVFIPKIDLTTLQARNINYELRATGQEAENLKISQIQLPN